jgi:hypothetical protein
MGEKQRVEQIEQLDSLYLLFLPLRQALERAQKYGDSIIVDLQDYLPKELTAAGGRWTKIIYNELNVRDSIRMCIPTNLRVVAVQGTNVTIYTLEPTTKALPFSYEKMRSYLREKLFQLCGVL